MQEPIKLTCDESSQYINVFPIQIATVRHAPVVPMNSSFPQLQNNTEFVYTVVRVAMNKLRVRSLNVSVVTLYEV